MYIYKITNILNNKIYIGQVYNKSVESRFRRHVSEASSTAKSYIDRAIHKYGESNFIVEEIDTASSLSELNEKEKYWIKFYNSTDNTIGYNLTPGGDGGNTYLCKDTEEMQVIKDKISERLRGANNGMSKQIKGYNYKTKEIVHFDTVGAATAYFNIRNKGMIMRHCNKCASGLYRGEWTFAYEGDDFNYSMSLFDPSTRKGKRIKIIDKKSGESIVFNSINKLSKYLNYSNKTNLNKIIDDYSNIYNFIML